MFPFDYGCNSETLGLICMHISECVFKQTQQHLIHQSHCTVTVAAFHPQNRATLIIAKSSNYVEICMQRLACSNVCVF